MFIFHDTKNNKLHGNANDLKHDFVRFVPKSFGIEKKDLKIYWIECHHNDEHVMGDLSLVGDKVVCQTKVMEGEGEDAKMVDGPVHEHTFKELKWPYDKDGKFDQKLWGL